MQNFFNGLKKEISSLGAVDLMSYNSAKTAVVVIDMINGFCKHGSLSDNRILAIVPKIKKLLQALPNSRKIFFRDEHTSDSLEFKSFPQHCLGNEESVVIDELASFVETDIAKNSTNGFFNFIQTVALADFDNIIICGCCTDICVLQFALTLKSYCNEKNIEKNILIPANGVATFDSPQHPAEIMDLFSLKILQGSGITLFAVKE